MKRKAIRSTRSGKIFPMNDDMLKSDDTELVYVDEKGQVIEPEEIGPVDAMDLPGLGENEEENEEESEGGEKDVEDKEPAKATDSAEAGTRRAAGRRKSS